MSVQLCTALAGQVKCAFCPPVQATHVALLRDL